MNGITKTGFLLFLLKVFILSFTIPVSLIQGRSPNNQTTASLIEVYRDSAMLFLNAGELDKAVLYYTTSHALCKSIFGPRSEQVAQSHMNLTEVFVHIKEFDSALNHLKMAEAIYNTFSTTLYTAQLADIYTHYGRIYYHMGDYVKAENYVMAALNNLDVNSSSTEDKRSLSILYLLRGMINKSIGNIEESLQYLNNCLATLSEIPDQTDLLIFHFAETALVYSLIGKIDESIKLQEKALQLCMKDSAKNAIYIAILYNNTGYDYMELNQLEKAELNFLTSQRIFTESGYTGHLLCDLHESMGQLAERKNRYHEALGYYQKGLHSVIDSYNPEFPDRNPGIEEIRSWESVLYILKSKIKCLQKLYTLEQDIYYLDAAVNTSLASLDLIEYQRNSYQTLKSKMFLSFTEHQTYQEALALSLFAHKESQNPEYAKLAFTLSEKTKSSVLLSAMRELNAKKLGEIPDNLLEKEKSLIRRITYYNRSYFDQLLYSAPLSRMDTLPEELFEAHHEHDQLISLFEKEYPKYYALKYENSVISVEEIQERLPKNTTLLEYTLTDSILYTFVITHNNYHVQSRRTGGELTKNVLSCLDEYRRFDFDKQHEISHVEFCQRNKKLYDLLIAPVKPYIKGKNLLIVPDGLLSYLPFETLIASMPENAEKEYFNNTEFLINEYTVSYAYSSTLFAEVNIENDDCDIKEVLAFAPEYEDISGNREKALPRGPHTGYRDELTTIPGAYKEVVSIEKLLPSQIFTGHQATETNFRATAGKHDILHLAMHTILDNKDPMLSKLVFSRHNDSLNDGLLTTREIYSLNLKARMVVLSACNTAEGEYSRGEGVISLARGFVYAGAPSLVMTLWRVDDKSSVELMEYFYEFLLKGHSKAEALRKAKLKYIKQAPKIKVHPFFWSSSVLSGNIQPLYKCNRTRNTVFYCIGGGFILIFVLWFFKRRKKRIENRGA